MLRNTLSDAELKEIFRLHRLWMLKRAEGKQANFSKAFLEKCNFALTSLQYAIFKGASLRGANLRGAILCKSCLDGANLTGADLHAVNLNNVNLSSVNGIVRLSENELLVKGTNIIYTYDGTIWQEPYILTNYYLTRSRRSF